MFINTYSYRDNGNSEWVFSRADLKRINLFVGVSGSGKSRFLNTLINISSFIHTGVGFRAGEWEISFECNKKLYNWTYKATDIKGKYQIDYESLTQTTENQAKEIFRRDQDTFIFNGLSVPKLPKDSSSIYLLKEEELVNPVHRAFGRIYRRSFFGSALMDSSAIGTMPRELMTNDDSWKKYWEINAADLSVNTRLAFLYTKDRQIFDSIIREYKNVFPHILDAKVVDGSELFPGVSQGVIPAVIFTERNVKSPIYLHDLSSGMLKVLLIIVDVLTIQPHSIYSIDEYENSLGINAINFLPSFLAEFGEKHQFIVTSHHPYLINNIPTKNWHLFTRDGSKVSIQSGNELEEKFGQSKQEAFIQLINDPQYK